METYQLRRRRAAAALVLDADSISVRPQDLSFQSRDGDKLVPCGISRDALNDLGGYHRLAGAEDEVFRALRPEIERLASAKYRAGRHDGNGAISIGPADILLYGFERRAEAPARPSPATGSWLRKRGGGHLTSKAPQRGSWRMPFIQVF